MNALANAVAGLGRTMGLAETPQLPDAAAYIETDQDFPFICGHPKNTRPKRKNRSAPKKTRTLYFPFAQHERYYRFIDWR